MAINSKNFISDFKPQKSPTYRKSGLVIGNKPDKI